ncbi:cysteine hydrolase family protein [Pontibacillus marinus]|uniref:Isochorismatase n=1 Tax=Pontibacillus marinus BH030004 = DSM 16465 TaxID=1385511 RepID=A0A0A5G1H7_9BACI|nr:isochorismatase family cysteine hydrolase [Pontibacillus marinus]KGX86951.1 isochorismatase [Pontibacillus marinus BH030004 = DSM 16465]
MHPPNQTAVLIVDMINDFQFSHGETLLSETKKMLPNIIQLKQYAKQHHFPIIYVNDHYSLWQADLHRIYQKCLHDQNRELLDQIVPHETDYFLIKPKHSAFHQTALQALLSELGIKHLIITGIAGNICVLFTANDAYMREYSLSVPQDCIASNDEQDNAYALKMMENVLKADITPTSQFL